MAGRDDVLVVVRPALDAQQEEELRRDVAQVAHTSEPGCRVPHGDPEGRVQRVPGADVLDVAVIADEEEQRRRVKPANDSGKERVDGFEGLYGAAHAASVPGGVGRVVSVQREIVASRDPGEVRTGLLGRDVGERFESEVTLPPVVEDLTGDGITVLELAFMPREESGTSRGQGRAGDPTTSSRAWPPTWVRVGERGASACVDDSTKEVPLFDHGSECDRGPRSEVTPVQLGGTLAREQRRLSRAALGRAFHTEGRVEREDAGAWFGVERGQRSARQT